MSDSLRDELPPYARHAPFDSVHRHLHREIRHERRVYEGPRERRREESTRSASSAPAVSGGIALLLLLALGYLLVSGGASPLLALPLLFLALLAAWAAWAAYALRSRKAEPEDATSSQRLEYETRVHERDYPGRLAEVVVVTLRKETAYRWMQRA